MIEPNGYLRFKTALGTETDIDCHVKISGPMCIWIGQYIEGEVRTQKIFIPNQDNIKKYSWFKECVKKYGEYQGVFARISKIVVPGEEDVVKKPAW